MLKWESILIAVETQKWWVGPGREAWHHIGASWISLTENLPIIRFKLANLEQTEGLHPVFPIS